MKKSEKQGDTLDMFSDSLQLGKQLRMTKQEKCGQADKGEGWENRYSFANVPSGRPHMDSQILTFLPRYIYTYFSS